MWCQVQTTWLSKSLDSCAVHTTKLVIGSLPVGVHTTGLTGNRGVTHYSIFQEKPPGSMFGVQNMLGHLNTHKKWHGKWRAKRVSGNDSKVRISKWTSNKNKHYGVFAQWYVLDMGERLDWRTFSGVVFLFPFVLFSLTLCPALWLAVVVVKSSFKIARNLVDGGNLSASLWNCVLKSSHLEIDDCCLNTDLAAIWGFFQWGPKLVGKWKIGLKIVQRELAIRHFGNLSAQDLRRFL